LAEFFDGIFHHALLFYIFRPWPRKAAIFDVVR